MMLFMTISELENNQSIDHVSKRVLPYRVSTRDAVPSSRLQFFELVEVLSVRNNFTQRASVRCFSRVDLG